MVFRNCAGRVAAAWGLFLRLLPSTQSPSVFCRTNKHPEEIFIQPHTQAGAVFSRVSISFANQLAGNNSSNSTESRIQVLKKIFFSGAVGLIS